MTCTNTKLRTIICDSRNYENFDLSDVTEANNVVIANLINDFYDHFEFEQVEISKAKYITFVKLIQRSYLANPYHNFNHAIDATITLAYLLNITNFKFGRIEKVALCLAMLCHDVGHFGKTGSFVQKYCEDITSVCKSTSPLEEYHLNIFADIVDKAGLFEDIDGDSIEYLNDIITKCIMSTDPATTTDFIKNGTDSHKLIIKCADIGSSLKSFKIHVKWADRLMEEFFAQGDDITEKGDVPMDLFDHTKINKMPSNQIWFFENYAIPLFAKSTEFDDNDLLMCRLVDTRERWRNRSMAWI